jgi:hypothetical protein
MPEKELPLKSTPISVLEERGPNNPPKGSESWRVCQILTDQHFTMLTPKTALPSTVPVKKERRIESASESDQENREKSP